MFLEPIKGIQLNQFSKIYSMADLNADYTVGLSTIHHYLGTIK